MTMFKGTGGATGSRFLCSQTETISCLALSSKVGCGIAQIFAGIAQDTSESVQENCEIDLRTFFRC